MTNSERSDFTTDRPTDCMTGMTAEMLEEQRKALEAGFERGEYQLVILEIADIDKLCGALLTLGMMYAEPEEAYGAVWRTPKPYTCQKLAAHLRNLPVVFRNYNEIFAYHADRALKEAGSVVYRIERVSVE